MVRYVAGAFLPPTCKADDLAIIFGVSKRTVQKLAEAGIIPRAQHEPGHYQTIESCHGYTKHLREKAAGRSEDAKMTSERALTVEIERRIKQHKLAELEGEVIPVEKVSAAWSAICISFKRKLMATPSKLRSLIPNLTNHNQAQLTTFFTDLLTELAEEVALGVVGAKADQLHDKPIKRRTKARSRVKKGSDAARAP